MTDTTDIDPSTVHERELVLSKSLRKTVMELRNVLEIKRRHSSPTNPAGDMDPRTKSDLKIVEQELKWIWENENGLR